MVYLTEIAMDWHVTNSVRPHACKTVHCFRAPQGIPRKDSAPRAGSQDTNLCIEQTMEKHSLTDIKKLKDEGNKFFKAQSYEQALTAYFEASNLDYTYAAYSLPPPNNPLHSRWRGYWITRDATQIAPQKKKPKSQICKSSAI